MPPDYDRLKHNVLNKQYLFTAHASSRVVQRNIASNEIEEVVIDGSVIEDYPDDKYSPSCLVMGQTKDARILHVQVSYPPSVKIITVYEPSPDEWENDWKTRK
jgi:hypothetical protein